MPKTTAHALSLNFLGDAPVWYKLAILAFLVANPLLMVLAGPFVTGWLLVLEFIFTLAMALKCYPLPPGGLLALQAVVLGLTTPQSLYDEVTHNISVILLLVFMVAGIHFMKELLQYTFTGLLLRIRSKALLSLFFCFTAAFLSAFLDALTVTAVIIAVVYGFYGVYHAFVSEQGRKSGAADDLDQFRAFLRNLMMHAAVGTALGGVTTLVGEPQNLLIGSLMEWDFITFAVKVAPVSAPVVVIGLLTCLALERFRLFGYGHSLPPLAREVLARHAERVRREKTEKEKARLLVQGLVGLVLVAGLALHMAEVGILGLMVIVLLTAFTGVTEEHRIGRAFEEALPFTALLVVFFTVVAVIHDQHLFQPVIDLVLPLTGPTQRLAFYVANGLLSAISDNVFVATVYITETAQAFAAGKLSREQFELLAVAINTGTNIPSIATPNGQAAFLFLLTSTLAPLIQLSYGRMLLLALPYTVVLSLTGLVATWLY